MLEVYLVSLAVGGLFVALSAFTGGDADADFDADADADFDADADADFDADADADFDADADADFDADADADVDVDAGGGGGIDKSSLMVVDDSSEISRRGIWLPFLSFRFWTFTSAFFGLTGLLLTLLSTVGQIVIFPSSLALGLASGFGVAYTLHRLKRENVDSALKVKTLVGQEALVVLPIDADHKGKIRIEHGMRRVELLAATDEREPLERGDTVVVIRMEGDTAHVVRPSRLLG